MEQTPIELAISIMRSKGQSPCDIEHLLQYEKTYHRNIAEKAWDRCEHAIMSWCSYEELKQIKEDYLKQNHPL